VLIENMSIRVVDSIQDRFAMATMRANFRRCKILLLSTIGVKCDALATALLRKLQGKSKGDEAERSVPAKEPQEE
jgi:hypothetical protein